VNRLKEDIGESLVLGRDKRSWYWYIEIRCVSDILTSCIKKQ